jgi:hypothetical protein
MNYLKSYKARWLSSGENLKIRASQIIFPQMTLPLTLMYIIFPQMTLPLTLMYIIFPKMTLPLTLMYIIAIERNCKVTAYINLYPVKLKKFF